MFGRRFRFLFAPIPDTEGAGAPAGGGAPPPVVPAPPAGDAKPPAPPAAPVPPVVPPTVDLESPAIKQLIAAAQAKAASEARLQALTEAKEAAEEAKRVAIRMVDFTLSRGLDADGGLFDEINRR